MAVKKSSEDAPISQMDPFSDAIGKVDTKYEIEGDWFTHASMNSVKVGPNEIDGYQGTLLDENGNGFRGVKVRSWHLPEFKRAAKDMGLRAGRMKESKREEYEKEAREEATARLLVMEWDFTNRNGDQYPCTPELVKQVLSDPAMRPHSDFITLALDKLHHHEKEIVEGDEGN